MSENIIDLIVKIVIAAISFVGGIGVDRLVISKNIKKASAKTKGDNNVYYQNNGNVSIDEKKK